MYLGPTAIRLPVLTQRAAVISIAELKRLMHTGSICPMSMTSARYTMEQNATFCIHGLLTKYSNAQ